MKIMLTKRYDHGWFFLFALIFGLALGGNPSPAQQHPFSSTPDTFSNAVGDSDLNGMQNPETTQQPARVPFDEWSLAKPDYSPLQGQGFDPRLETVLEQMRLSINAMQEEIVQSKEFLPQYQSLQYRMLMGPLMTYIQLLRETGLDIAAERVLDSLPKSYDNNQPVFDIRRQLQARPPRPAGNADNPVPLKMNVQQIASTLQSISPGGDGYFNYFSRPQVVRDGYAGTDFGGYGGAYYPAMPQPMNDANPESPDDKSIRIREKSYSAFARALVATEKPDLDEVLQWNKQLTQNNRSSNDYRQQLSCAILLSAMGEQDAANQAVDNAFLVATTYDQDRIGQQRDDRVQVEGVVIRDVHVWQSFIDALMRIGEYDAAVKMLREMRESLTKLQAAGENIYWNQLWNELAGRLATFSALEGDLDRALEYSELLLTKQERNNVLFAVAGHLFRQGRMDEMKRVTDSEHYVPPGYSFVDVNARYNQAKEIAKTGSREEALAALLSLFEPDGQNRQGVPTDPALRNELGLLFLKWDDGNNARKLFTMVNDMIKTSLEQQDRSNSGYMLGQYDQFARFLAARYRAGLTGETLDFAKTIRQTPDCIILNSTLAEEIANELNKTEVVELLNTAWQTALTLEPNPGIPDIPDPNRVIMPNRFVFRNDYLWAVARAALVADCLPEAQRFIHEAKSLDANIPVISIKVRMMLNSYHQAFQTSGRDQLWMSGMDRMLKKERRNFDAAIIAASNVESPHARNNAFARIAWAMLKISNTHEGATSMLPASF